MPKLYVGIPSLMFVPHDLFSKQFAPCSAALVGPLTSDGELQLLCLIGVTVKTLLASMLSYTIESILQ